MGPIGPTGPTGPTGAAALSSPGQYAANGGPLVVATGGNVSFPVTLLSTPEFTHPNATDFVAQEGGTFLVNFYIDVSSATAATTISLALNGLPVPASNVSIPITTAGSYSGSDILIVLPGDIVTLMNIGPGTITTAASAGAITRISMVKLD